MKIQGSHKFIAAVLGLILATYLGWMAYAAIRLSNVVLDVIEPGNVNIVAVRPAAGYRIIVSNQIAYLAKVDGDLQAGEMEVDDDSVTSTSRLPIRELMQTLQGDEKALGVLIMRLNDWAETDDRTGTTVWRAEDIEKALAGDAALQAKLVADLNVDLKGVPLDEIRTKSIVEGIIIESPVPVQVMVGGQERTLVGRVQEHYQPLFCSTVYNRFRELPPGRDNTAYMSGVYREIATPIVEAGGGEDVRRSLEGRISSSRLASLTERPRQVLDNTVILLNEGHITSADYTAYEVGQGREACDVSIGLTEPGRMRLWKYSHDNRGFQLLFIVDSVAIAAPRITTDLAESTVTIRRVPSKDLVADAVARLNEFLTEKK